MAAAATEIMCRDGSMLQTPLTFRPFSIEVDIGRSSSAGWFQSYATSSCNRCDSSSHLTTAEGISRAAVVSKQDDLDRPGLVVGDGDPATSESVPRKKSEILLERYQLYTIIEQVHYAVANGRGYSPLFPKLQSLSFAEKRRVYNTVFEVMHCKL